MTSPDYVIASSPDKSQCPVGRQAGTWQAIWCGNWDLRFLSTARLLRFRVVVQSSLSTIIVNHILPRTGPRLGGGTAWQRCWWILWGAQSAWSSRWPAPCRWYSAEWLCSFLGPILQRQKFHVHIYIVFNTFRFAFAYISFIDYDYDYCYFES